MPKNRVDRTGLQFERLTIVEFSHRGPRRESFWICLCNCGRTHVAAWASLKSKNTKSCGCLHAENARLVRKTHGMSQARVYKIWKAMIKRCENPNQEKWHRYGGRGITVDPRWRASFEQFFADMGHPPDGMSIERKDNDKGYSVDNCVWATAKEQARNKSNVCMVEAFGERRTISEWSALRGVGVNTISRRLNAGISPERAVTEKKILTKLQGRPHGKHVR